MQDRVVLGNCLDHLPKVSAGSVDLVLTDLPYGTTKNKWDSLIPLDPLFEQLWRVLKPNGVIVMTAAQPFTSVVVCHQLSAFRYDWVWQKPKGTGHLNAKLQPLRDKEDILVFAKKGKYTYNPQMSSGTPYAGTKGRNITKQSTNYSTFASIASDNHGVRYPKQVIQFNPVGRNGNKHPTEKPVALFEYLIRAYTNKGDTVLDCCAGVGTTGVAAKKTGRHFILMEQDRQFYNIATKRLAAS